MKLYLITRAGPREDIGWDQAAGFVVAADTENHARQLIKDAWQEQAYADDSQPGPGAEGWVPWLDPGATPCKPIGVATFYGAAAKPGIILRDFKAG